MAKTKTTKKQTPRKGMTGSKWTEEGYREELNTFRRAVRSVFTFSEKMRRNKVRNPEPLKELISAAQTHANNVIQMFPAGHAVNPRITQLEQKRAEIDRKIALAKKTA